MSKLFFGWLSKLLQSLIGKPNENPNPAIRAEVFEVIVRQALAGAPWREICASPMRRNNITAEEVEAEVERRRSGGAKP